MKILILILVCISNVIAIDVVPEIEVEVIVPKQTKDLIKQFEGLRLKAYLDIAGKCSIGYGHYNLTPPTVTPDMIITQDRANSILDIDLEHTLSLIQGHISADLTDNQLAAILSFSFNEGAHAFINSTLLKELNAGNIEAAADEFLKWERAGNQIIAGLKDRRIAERELFLTPDTEEVINVAGK